MREVCGTTGIPHTLALPPHTCCSVGCGGGLKRERPLWIQRVELRVLRAENPLCSHAYAYKQPWLTREQAKYVLKLINNDQIPSQMFIAAASQEEGQLQHVSLKVRHKNA